MGIVEAFPASAHLTLKAVNQKWLLEILSSGDFPEFRENKAARQYILERVDLDKLETEQQRRKLELLAIIGVSGSSNCSYDLYNSLLKRVDASSRNASCFFTRKAPAAPCASDSETKTCKN